MPFILSRKAIQPLVGYNRAGDIVHLIINYHYYPFLAATTSIKWPSGRPHTFSQTSFHPSGYMNNTKYPICVEIDIKWKTTHIFVFTLHGQPKCLSSSPWFSRYGVRLATGRSQVQSHCGSLFQISPIDTKNWFQSQHKKGLESGTNNRKVFDAIELK